MNPSTLEDQLTEFESFLRENKDIAESTVGYHVASVMHFLKYVNTIEPTDADVMEYRQELIESSVPDSRINEIQTGIECFFEFQGRGDEVGEYKRLPHKQPVREPLTEEEMRQLIMAGDLPEIAVLSLVYSTGMRPTALRNLSYEDITL